MKLTKKEAERIANEFCLGDLKKYNLIQGGYNNYNFDVLTEKGRYIYRIIYNQYNRERELIKFRVLRDLEKNKFPYELTIPIRNSKGTFFSVVNNKPLWIYKKIIGKTIRNLNRKQIKEIAKALAIYHKKIKQFQLKRKPFRDYGFYKKEYDKMKKVKPKNKLDSLMLSNIDFFYGIVKTMEKLNFDKNVLLIHSNFSEQNMIFRKNKLIGFIDFEEWDIAPRILDIAYTSKHACWDRKKIDKKLLSMFIEEYNKYNKLTKKEISLLPLFILYDYCIAFWAFYRIMKKISEKQKYEFMEWAINRTKKIYGQYTKDLKILKP